MTKRLFFIVLCTLGLILGTFYFVDFLHGHPVLTQIFDSTFFALIGLSISLQMAGHWLRAYKSKILINRIRPARTVTLFRGLSIGYLFNSLLPLRLGEFIRAYYVGDSLAISKTTVFMSIIIERVVDGLLLGGALITAALLIRHDSKLAAGLITNVGIVLLTVSIVLLLVIYVMRSEKKWLLALVYKVSQLLSDSIMHRLRFMAWSGIYGTRRMLASPRETSRYIGFSIGMWVVYFASTLLAVLAYFQALAPHQLWYAIQSIYAGVSTPAGPAYVGSFHLAVSKLLTQAGIVSISGFTFFMWLVIIAPISLVGLWVLIRHRFSEVNDPEMQASLINKLHREGDISEEMGNFLDAYFKGERINQLLTQAELEDKFRLIKSFKGGSNAHTMLVWQGEKLLVKKITLEQYADKLREQAGWLKSRKHLPHLPRVVSEEPTPYYYSFDLAYHEDFYPFFDYIHAHSVQNSVSILNRMLTFMEKSIYHETGIKDAKKKLNKYIEGKVIGKVNDTAALSTDISKLISEPTLVINGKQYLNLLQVVDKIKQNKVALADLASFRESPIHGDLTVDNLIASAKGDFMVIDPNNENEVSCPSVDYGKLYQSLHSGYEFLIQLESCSVRDNTVEFSEEKSHKYAEIFADVDAKLKKRLKPEEYRTILFHEAVHYCRMLTYRVNINPQTVAVFYATAVKLFNEFLDQYAE